MSGSSSSSLGAILGGVIGALALLGLIVLAAFWYRERRRRREEYSNVEGLIGGGHDSDFEGGLLPEMGEGPRTAFRHESFMALVKDAAKGFYAPTMDMNPRGSEGAGASAAAGATGATGAAVMGDAYDPVYGNRQSSSSEQSLQYLETASAAPSSPPHAHARPT
ncbi:hypothetical protein EDD11_010544 [Mortierella claussenii]|nr:hypothetical protein EDD11_010544 [Mortierella claussenii]